MKKIRSTLVILTMCVLLTNCASFSEVGKVMRNEKTGNTDEFLIKKREPLTLPPNFEEIPKPGTALQENEEEEIKKILKVPKSKNVKQSGSSSLEDYILNRIRK